MPDGNSNATHVLVKLFHEQCREFVNRISARTVVKPGDVFEERPSCACKGLMEDALISRGRTGLARNLNNLAGRLEPTYPTCTCVYLQVCVIRNNFLIEYNSIPFALYK